MKWEEWSKKGIKKVVKNFSLNVSAFQVPERFRSRHKSNEMLFKKFNDRYPNLCSSLKEFYLFIQHKDEENFVELLFCPTCGKRLKVSTICCNKGWGVPHFCSRKCSAISDSTKQRRVETVRELYGVDNISQSEGNKEKISKFWKEIKEEIQKKRETITNKTQEKRNLIDIRKIKYVKKVKATTEKESRNLIHENHKKNTIKSIIRFIGNNYTEPILKNSLNKKYNFTCDIRLPNLKLAIVVYDPMLESFNDYSKESPSRLQKTAEALDKSEYSHLFISSWDWHFKRDIWKSVLLQSLGLAKKLSAKKCQVKEINSDLASNFLEENHFQGKKQSSINLGLFFKEELVSIMTFKRIESSKGYDWELTRFCDKVGFSVEGGASKLLTFFKKDNKGTIISYASRHLSSKNLYRTLGFKLDSVLAPNYGYVKEGEFKIFPKNIIQKEKLEKNLSIFSSQKSEAQDTYSNGYRRIFNSGYIKYVLE